MKIFNKKYTLIYISIILVLLVFFSGLHKKVFQYIMDSASGIDVEYYSKMKSIEPGMKMDEVISILGEPDEISREKEIVQTHGKFGSGKDYGKKITNKNICLIYYHGADIVANYFIDKEGKVYFVNVGGT